MKWVEFSGTKIRYVEYNNKLHTLEKLADDNTVINLANSDKPLSTTFNVNSNFGKALYEVAKSNPELEKLGLVPDYNSFLEDTAPTWAEELIKNKVTSKDLSDAERLENDREARVKSDKEHLLYETYYAEFRNYMMEFDLSPLELIVSVSRCLVADSVREVIRAFVGYFQTINGFKATNVIAVGSPASGKSFILETAISMMPDKYIHRGVMTESAFFESFDGMDLTGHIFYLGDLGGANSDEKTIAFRELLKELSTDGVVTRTITKEVGKNREPVTQIVKGNPAISYSTANEEIINEQEKSRSILLTPQPILPNDLLIFNTVMRNNGIFKEDIISLHQIRDSVKGLVYCFNRNDYDFFNPYMFNVISTFEDNSDFNRKIKEFDATLEVVTLLDHPYSCKHDLYYDDESKKKETKLVFPSKRNNLNAMNLFDAVDFLPDEARLGDKLIGTYNVFDLDELNAGIVDESNNFEENVIIALKLEDQEWVCDEDIHNWKHDFFYNPYNDYFSPDYKKFKDYVFTVSTLKRRYGRKKWFKSHINYLSDRLRRLYEGGVLIILGKTDKNENVYALSNENGEKISVKIPSFTGKAKLNQSKRLFDILYPNHSRDFDDFLRFDEGKPDERSLTESVSALFPALPFLKDGDYNV